MKTSLRRKLLGGLAFLLLWMALIAAVNIYATRTVEKRLESTIQRDMQASRLLTELAGEVLLVQGNSAEHAEAAQRRADVLMNTLSSLLQDRQEQQKLAEFRNAWSVYLLARQEAALGVESIEGRVGEEAHTALRRLEEVRAFSISAAEQRLAAANREQWRAQNIMLAMIVLATMPAMAFAVHLSAQIMEAMHSVSNAAQLMASGDFDWSVTVRTGDEIEAMAESLNEITRWTKRTLAAQREAGEQLQRQIRREERITDMLATERDRLATTLDLISDGVIFADAQSNIVTINRAAEQLTGWPRHMVQGKQVSEVLQILDDTTREPHEDLVARVVQTGRRVRLSNHTLFIARSGAERRIVHSSAPIRDQDQDIVGAVITFHDIGEREQST
jgi:PAS domain S-box-containing protein